MRLTTGTFTQLKIVLYLCISFIFISSLLHLMYNRYFVCFIGIRSGNTNRPKRVSYKKGIFY